MTAAKAHPHPPQLHRGSIDESFLRCVTRHRRNAWASFVLCHDGIVHLPDGHPSGFCFSALKRRTAALCASDLCLFATRSSMRLCWMVDTVGRICFLFGLGCVGPIVFVVSVVDAVGSSLSPPVNGDRTELFAVIWTSTVGASRRGVLCFASRASR